MRLLVLYNGPLNPNGGSSGTVWQTNEALTRLGHEVDVITEDDISRFVSHHNLHYAFELPFRMLQAAKTKLSEGRYHAALISQPYGYLVGKWLRRRRSDTLYLHRSHGHELAVSHQLAPWDSLDAGRAYHRVLATRLLALRLAQQARLALRYADGTIVPSSFDRDFLIEKEGADPHRVRSIFHASVPAYLEAEPTPYTRERHQKLLYVGNFTKVKGQDILWAIGNAVLTKYPALSLTIVTNKSEHARVFSGFSPDVRRQVKVWDWVSQDALMKIYDEHGMQIIPSLYEGASKAHYEGMSRGLCMICSSIGAMRDSITSGKDGWLVQPGYINGFVAATSQLYERFDTARMLGQKGRARSVEFSWDRTAREIVDYADELIAERNHLREKATKRVYAISGN